MNVDIQNKIFEAINQAATELNKELGMEGAYPGWQLPCQKVRKALLASLGEEEYYQQLPENFRIALVWGAEGNSHPAQELAQLSYDLGEAVYSQMSVQREAFRFATLK